MDEDDEVLDVGAPGRFRRATPVLIFVAAAALLGGYLVSHHGGGGHDTAITSGSVVSPPAPTTVLPGNLPPWPQRGGACGNTAFLPLVSAHRLDQRTGIRSVVGDRLASVDVDSGRVTPTSGIPAGLYASQIATAANGTYALLAPCTQGAPSTVVRLTASGSVRRVARGPYSQLLAGGRHPWGVVYRDSDNTTLLDSLDGSPRRTLPSNFIVLGAWADLVVGTVQKPGAAPDAPFTIKALDPVTGQIKVDIGPVESVLMSGSVVVWTSLDCTSCRVLTYDLATGAQSTTRDPVAAIAGVGTGVVSPDRHTAAIVRQRSTPSQYDLGHPGNPNEIVLVDLRTGESHTMPGLQIWPKSTPGLAFSADSKWLVVSLDEGSGVRLLVWHPGLTQPLESPARLTSRVAFTPGLTTI